MFDGLIFPSSMPRINKESEKSGKFFKEITSSHLYAYVSFLVTTIQLRDEHSVRRYLQCHRAESCYSGLMQQPLHKTQSPLLLYFISFVFYFLNFFFLFHGVIFFTLLIITCVLVRIIYVFPFPFLTFSHLRFQLALLIISVRFAYLVRAPSSSAYFPLIFPLIIRFTFLAPLFIKLSLPALVAFYGQPPLSSREFFYLLFAVLFSLSFFHLV